MFSEHWLGADAMFLDVVDVQQYADSMILGRYGGTTANGADKNEDAALLACDHEHDWELALVIDAHYSADSARLLLETFNAELPQIHTLLALPVDEAIQQLHQCVLDMLLSEAFLARCEHIHGEASCMLVVRKHTIVWWFSIGDCVAYLLHPALARLGEYALNQRRFYEWIGHHNTFAQQIPCYTTGTRHLLNGLNTLVLLTDGVLECGEEPFNDPAILYDSLVRQHSSPEQATKAILARVQHEQGRDSATMIVWQCDTLK